MSLLYSSRRALLGGREISYLLRDEFTDTLAAGSVNGTSATPGPGTRVVTDANSKLSVGSGVLSVATGGAGANEPRLSYGALARVAGRVLIASTIITTEGAIIAVSDVNTAARQAATRLYDTSIAIDTGLAFWLVVGAYSTGTTYQIAIVERGSGEYMFIRGGAFTDWVLLYADGNGVDDPLYPIIGADDAASVYTVDYIRIPDILWLPTPIAYDTFSRANGVLGNSETSGPDGQAVVARTWESGGATWAIAGNEAVNTPTEGADVITNGDMEAGDPPNNWTASNCTLDGIADPHGGAQALEVTATAAPGFAHQTFPTTIGVWYRLDAWAKATAGDEYRITVYTNGWAGLATTQDQTDVVYTFWPLSFRATTATSIVGLAAWNNTDICIFDDVSCVPLTLNTLFSDIDDSATSDVIVTVEIDTQVGGASCGIVMNLDDEDAPANFVIAYRDYLSVVLVKCVAGTYTTVSTTFAPYAAGAELRVHKLGTAYRLYYNNILRGTGVIADAGIVSNTKHGLFSTYSGNQLDGFYVFPTGTGGEYGALEAW